MSKYIVNPIKVRMRESSRGSIYQSIVAMGLRARQINSDIRTELTARMEDIIPTSDEMDVVNSDQERISKEFEVLPKPSFIAMKEIFDGDLTYELPKE